MRWTCDLVFIWLIWIVNYNGSRHFNLFINWQAQFPFAKDTRHVASRHLEFCCSVQVQFMRSLAKKAPGLIFYCQRNPRSTHPLPLLFLGMGNVFQICEYISDNLTHIDQMKNLFRLTRNELWAILATFSIFSAAAEILQHLDHIFKRWFSHLLKTLEGGCTCEKHVAVSVAIS